MKNISKFIYLSPSYWDWFTLFCFSSYICTYRYVSGLKSGDFMLKRSTYILWSTGSTAGGTISKPGAATHLEQWQQFEQWSHLPALKQLASAATFAANLGSSQLGVCLPRSKLQLKLQHNEVKGLNLRTILRRETTHTSQSTLTWRRVLKWEWCCSQSLTKLQNHSFGPRTLLREHSATQCRTRELWFTPI